MRYRYLDDFPRGISVFAIFSYGIAVLGTPLMSPSLASCACFESRLSDYVLYRMHSPMPCGGVSNLQLTLANRLTH